MPNAVSSGVQTNGFTPLATKTTPTNAGGTSTGLASTNPQANTTTKSYGTTSNGTQGYVGGTPVSSPNTSTTTISNQNKINGVPSIINKTNQFSQTGITTDANGNSIYANGTLVPDKTTSTASGAPNLSNNTGLSGGGYVGDVYYAPGANLPIGTDGKPMKTTDTSPTDDQILSSIDSLKAQSDKTTASVIDSIHASYAALRQQQEQANIAQQGQTNAALEMGGVTGQGSSAQFAPVSSVAIMAAQVSYGLTQIAALNAKESSAIVEAQQAGLNDDFKLMDEKNAEISKVRDEKVAAATKLNDQIQTQNQKLADANLQAAKDDAVAKLVQGGVTDPAEILKRLSSQGLTIDAKEVADALSNIMPDSSSINNILLEAAKNGADKATLQAIRASKSVADAIMAAGTFVAPKPSPTDYNASPESKGYQTPPANGFRTDRNNNPTAMTTDVAKSLGLVEGVDYIQGDKFPGSSNLYTAHLIGDPIAGTIKGLDNAASTGKGAFVTASGKPRWTYINMTDQQWSALSDDQKKATVESMYKHEGGSGQLAGDINSTTGTITKYQSDPDGKMWKVTTKNGVVTSKTEQKTSDSVPQDIITTVGTNLQNHVGGDTHISPEDYNDGLQQWVGAGYGPKSYYDNFKKLVNPADPQDYHYYPN